MSTRDVNIGLLFLTAALIPACANVETPATLDGLSYQASKAVDAARADGQTLPSDPDQRVSLDKSMEKYRSSPMKIVDDETGEVLIICKWVTPMGTKFRKKVCAAREEFDAMRDANKKDTEDWKRSLNNPGKSN